MPPKKALGHVPPSGNPKVPVPPVKFASSSSISSSSTRSRKAGRGFTGFVTSLAIRILALYAIVAALFTCSSQPFSFNYSAKDPRAICRTLAHSKAQAVPLVTPAVHALHQKIDPYTGPYIKAATPYTRAAWKTAKPYYRQAKRQSNVIYKKHMDPLRKKAIKRGRAYSEPHIKTLNKRYNKQVKPHIDGFNKAVKPYQDIYTRDVAPYLSQAYVYSLTAGGASYAFYVKQVHPQVVSSLHQLHHFYINHFDPAVRRSYSLFIRPQVEKLSAKLFERKAHATGSEAISKAKQEVKAVEKEAKTRTQVMQTQAAEEVRRRRDDPNVLEKAEKAVQDFFGSLPDEDEEEDAAQLDAELKAELEKVKEQLEAWEVGMTKLLAQEYKLFTERVSELRNRRLADLPDHFSSLTEARIEDEVAAVLSRLDRAYRKASKSDLPVSAQIAQVKEVHTAQKAKLLESKEDLKAQVTAYNNELLGDEVRSLTASSNEVRRYVMEARKSFVNIMNDVKYERSVDDNEGWDGGMMTRASEFDKDLRTLLKGGKIESGMDAVDLQKEPRLESHVVDLQKRVEKLYSTAASQIDSYVRKGNMQLRGEGVMGSIGDTTDAVAEQARLLSEGAAANMYEAAMAARKKLGLAPKETPGILERIQNGANQASQSVASAVGSTQPTGKSAGEYVQGYMDSASSVAASAAGYKTTPESYIEILGEKAQEAAEAVGDAFTAATTSAGNVVSAVSDSVVKVIPTEIPGSGAGDAASSIYNLAQEQLGSISHSASKAAQSAAASIPGSSGLSSALGEAASSIVDTASRGVAQGSNSVKASVEGAGEAIRKSAESARDAVTNSVSGEDAKLVGKKPADKDYNTVGKAADALKEKVVHAEL